MDYGVLFIQYIIIGLLATAMIFYATHLIERQRERADRLEIELNQLKAGLENEQ